MATTRWLASRSRVGVDRSDLIAVPAGRFDGRWHCSAATFLPVVSISFLAEFTADGGASWLTVSGPTVFAAEAPERAPAGAPVEFIAEQDGQLRVTVDVSGAWLFAIDGESFESLRMSA